jgi:puromycin-sensitive aminopeptidase
MSTYLVAYVVGEYDYVETKDSNGVSMRVYTPIGKKEHGQFALDVRFFKEINKENILKFI